MTQSDENANEWEIWRWIDYSKLKNIKYLAEGGFGSIWKAEWVDMPEEVLEFYKSNQVALKKLKNSQEISSEFLKELTANFQCRDKYVLPILGITQDSMTKEYAIVLRYMKNGNLRDFLDQNKSLPWIERLWLFNSFIRGLKVIHRDLGLCRLTNETSSSGAYGVLPYISPEVLNKYQYSQASDIYSVGIIMWVILTGKRPFANRAYNAELAADIFNGLRPKTNKDTPQCYVELMELCWHKDPFKRPSAETIYGISENWIKGFLYNRKSADFLMFLNAEQKIHDFSEDEDLSSAETTHSEAYITSKLLPSDFNKLHIDNLNFYVEYDEVYELLSQEVSLLQELYAKCANGCWKDEPKSRQNEVKLDSPFVDVTIENDIGTVADNQKAFKFFNLADNKIINDFSSNSSSLRKPCNLSKEINMYFNGLDVEKNTVKAFQIYSKAADEGTYIALNCTAYYCDVKKMKKTLAGNIDAMFNALAKMKKEHLDDFEGSEKRFSTAQRNLDHTCEMLYEGWGTQKDIIKAVYWLNKANEMEILIQNNY
ncbi:hypothetical protein Glove_66g89 [Diversispora epigaea]|uniref:Protein kinase domain-containing protein n=1 Tax=Diversispora epigaea TaxID=1348612 RepID=A0A397JAQ1_9GLOM|nr:hypothetical protein Glove_66g89 [Diversispora epigaea]